MGQESNTSSLTCLCNHLTAFGRDVLVVPNTIDFALVQQAFDSLDPGDLLVLITVCTSFLVYFVVLVIARRADNRDVLKVCINNLYNDIASSSFDNFESFAYLDGVHVSMAPCNDHRRSFRGVHNMTKYEQCNNQRHTKMLLNKVCIKKVLVNRLLFHFPRVHRTRLNETSITITAHTCCSPPYYIEFWRLAGAFEAFCVTISFKYRTAHRSLWRSIKMVNTSTRSP